MKKATLSVAAKIFLLVLTGFVVIFLMMSYFPPLRAAVLKNVNIIYTPTVEPVSGGFAFMKEPLNNFKSAMEKARDSPTESGCLVLPEALPGDFADYSIFIQKQSGGTDIFVEKEGIKSEFLTVDRMYPCAVYGSDGAGVPVSANFYDNWLDSTRCPKCKKDFVEYSEIIIPAADKITIDGQKHDREDALYLYKADKEHICFFVTYDGDRTCDADKDGIDDDCANAIRAALPDCAAPVYSTTTTTTTMMNNQCEEYSNSHGGGFACQDMAACGFARDATGLAQCAAAPDRCVKGKCTGDVYNVCCKR